LLKVAVTGVDKPTLVPPEVGDSVVTVGDPASVINSQETGELMATPALFLAPLTVAV
jgi:hypothetical protein